MGKKKKSFTDDDAALLAELGVETQSETVATYTPRQERIIAGFEEIQRFVDEHKRAPQHGEDRDIFERLYAVRLDRIRASEECVELLRNMDPHGLLDESATAAKFKDDATDDELLEALGVDAVSMSEDDVTNLTHVRPRAEVNAAEEVAQRIPCADFEKFKPIFEQAQRDLNDGTRRTVKHQDDFDPVAGDMFIVSGQKVLIAEMGKRFTTEYSRSDRRLRVIYDNGTESPNLLLRSLQRALNRDTASRQILPPDGKGMPLFADQIDEEDVQSGHIYVVRSLSDDLFIAEHRELIHKIGVTGQEVKKRIAGAKKDPTFLLADVELVASYTLANINRGKLEKLLHRFFAEARIDVQLADRFQDNVEPQEWFLVPLDAIHRAVKLLMSGEIERYGYDLDSASIVETKASKSCELGMIDRSQWT